MHPTLAYERLTDAHPDWTFIVEDPDFQEWSIPRFGNEIHPDQMIAILDLYKSDGGIPIH